MSKISALLLIGVVLLVLSGCQPVLLVPEEAAPAQAVEEVEPIRVGSTLPLTGMFAPTGGQVHPIIGDIFLKKINESGGLLGRPVEWVVLDDGSSPDNAVELYEQLIAEENVDLLIGPHGSASIAAAMDVAEAHDMVFPHHTGSMTYDYEYKWQFPLWANSLHPNIANASLLFDALESTGTPPENVAFLINQFGGTLFTARGQDGVGGAVDVAKERGYDVVLDVEYAPGTTDFVEIAQQVKEANPDFLYIAGVGTDANHLLSAMNELVYRPPGIFVQWPARGPLLEVGDGVLSITLFEPYEPLLSHRDAAEVNTLYTEAASEAGMPYPVLDTIGAVSSAAWQVLISGVEGSNSLDQAEIAEWLLNNEVYTILGPMTFNAEEQNFGDNMQKISQVQDGKWVIVYPPDFATEGYELQFSPQ